MLVMMKLDKKRLAALKQSKEALRHSEKEIVKRSEETFRRAEDALKHSEETLRHGAQMARRKAPAARNSLMSVLGYLLLGFICFIFYGYLYTSVFKFPLPKTLWLEKENAALLARFNLLDSRMDEQDNRLSDIRMRDNGVYRSLFGMDTIPQEAPVPDSVDRRYSMLKLYKNGYLLESAQKRMDMLLERSAVQSRSFDEVELIAKRTDEMAGCIPNISPVDMHISSVSISSSFGSRVHPISGEVQRHNGIDIRGPRGLPVYATANGTVILARSNYLGYGKCVLIDHGFGYKTRYAHLNKMFVEEGQTVTRGECIAAMGRTGRSTGTHLHYEVLYHNNPVNPWSYLDDLSRDEYRKITGRRK